MVEPAAQLSISGTPGANLLAREADLVIGIGTRYSDFTTASKTAFANPDVRFLNINIADFDAHKHSGLALVADALVLQMHHGEGGIVGLQARQVTVQFPRHGVV